MTRQVKLLPAAVKSYTKILDYLQEEWGEKVLQEFIKETTIKLGLLSGGQVSGMRSTRKNIQRLLLTRHNYVYYRIKPRKKEIEELLFWDIRQNPQRLKY